ncbi:hypothetical protein L1987_40511 [Smallanthus sonchifolius]|uniref:Uncharacterized protein n=1 Tax=Smallanthus sonchifolius TaxID=185202 RepID=A0ACB9GUE6_9ASTR|nr:hypothetical protein L1987_40511 [Smallanthus sonchifolius]
MLSLRTQSSPKSLSDATRTLSEKQLDCVRAMGFGKILSFNVDGKLRLLGHYVVDNLDTERVDLDDDFVNPMLRVNLLLKRRRRKKRKRKVI